jgi:hypothetical protein
MRYRSGSSLVHKITRYTAMPPEPRSRQHHQALRFALGSDQTRLCQDPATIHGLASEPIGGLTPPYAVLPDPVRTRPMMCRFLDAGNDDEALHLGGRRRKKAPRHEVAGSLAHGYGDLIFALVIEVGAMPARGDLDGVSKEPGRVQWGCRGEADAEKGKLQRADICHHRHRRERHCEAAG